MKILVDMNLPRSWIRFLQDRGHEAIHWSEIGPSNAPDTAILAWARENEHIVFTHDLDFGTLLALTHETGPSVLQIRTQDIVPSAAGNIVIQVLNQEQSSLEKGALVSVDKIKSRVRILPIQ